MTIHKAVHAFLELKRDVRHSLSSAAPRFNSLANYVVCIFPAITVSYDSTIELGFKLLNVQLNRNVRLFILFMFDQLRKTTFSIPILQVYFTLLV